ncbi:MAG: RNA pseudouridine synthase [Acidobacteriota bacterium]|nr:RNA pseudouridine synthase [Acidobacteriota bacterium]
MKHVKMIYRGKADRFDKVLSQVTGLRPDEIELLVAMGGAYLGKYRCKDPAHIVHSGREVSAWYQLPLTMEPVPFLKEWVVADADGLLIAAKPSGIPTQGRRDADYMAFYELLKQNLSGYIGLHHRLDQDTSGLMLFTRDRALNAGVAALFRDRKVHKAYLALAYGSRAGSDEEVVDAPIGAERTAGGTRYAVMSSGKKAVTRIKRIYSHDHLHLVEAQPLTGRTHQIRVHLAHLGLPLLGDRFYNGPAHDRFYLHCYRLQWPEGKLLPAGDRRLGVPRETWFNGLPTELQAAYDEWWRQTCSS